MAQNIYDTPDFFRGYSQLQRSVRGLDGAPEWPAIYALLPDMKGKRIVDLGCGFGWFARWARQHGAAEVLGLDVSHNMIQRATADTRDAGIVYRLADLETLDLPANSFDLAYSSLAFHYIADFGRLMRTIHRGLVSQAHLVFSIEHPVYMAAAQPQWITDAEGRKTWPVNGYAREGLRTTDWLAKDVVKYHRTMATTLNTLLDTGFSISRLVEFAPTAEQIAAAPQLAEELERPMMLIVAAQRTG
jgi:ubiquinone/menaquinone biosynthesis C-methylase UbiE